MSESERIQKLEDNNDEGSSQKPQGKRRAKQTFTVEIEMNQQNRTSSHQRASVERNDRYQTG